MQRNRMPSKFIELLVLRGKNEVSINSFKYIFFSSPYSLGSLQKNTRHCEEGTLQSGSKCRMAARHHGACISAAGEPRTSLRFFAVATTLNAKDYMKSVNRSRSLRNTHQRSRYSSIAYHFAPCPPNIRRICIFKTFGSVRRRSDLATCSTVGSSS